MAPPYRVVIADNFHYQDEDEHVDGGTFATAEEALARCRQIVDEYLAGALKTGMSANDLYDSFTSFGEDPFIASPSDVDFSAWDYARSRCEQLLPSTA